MGGVEGPLHTWPSSTYDLLMQNCLNCGLLQNIAYLCLFWVMAKHIHENIGINNEYVYHVHVGGSFLVGTIYEELKKNVEILNYSRAFNGPKINA